MIDKVLLDILACPACRGEVREEDGWVVCLGCGRKYPVKNGVPIILVDEAEQ